MLGAIVMLIALLAGAAPAEASAPPQNAVLVQLFPVTAGFSMLYAAAAHISSPTSGAATAAGLCSMTLVGAPSFNNQVSMSCWVNDLTAGTSTPLAATGFTPGAVASASGVTTTTVGSSYALCMQAQAIIANPPAFLLGPPYCVPFI